MSNKYFKAVKAGKKLNEHEMMEAMEFIMEGRALNEDLAPFLTKLAERDETVEEITGAARILRKRAVGIKSPKGTVDCCGTGGDKSNTYNISTAVAFVAAAAGVPMAKHGNRASTSKCGAADILETLGVYLNIPIPALEEALRRYNFAFLLAPRHHPAMKHVAVVRKKIGTPTIFNLVGPLSNPAGASLQLIGVYDRRWVAPVAEALKNLGSERAWVVHGNDGLDELTVTCDSLVAILDKGEVTLKTLTPEDFGLKRHKAEELKGGTNAENAAALRSVLEGQKGAYRDIVLMNAAAVLNIHGKAKNLKDGVKKAAEAIDSGAALQTLKDYIVFTREHHEPEQKLPEKKS
jgi:anthranilate phosphoribosyltransferase